MAGRKTDKAGVEPAAAISPDLTLDEVSGRLWPDHLEIIGGFTCVGDAEGLPTGTQTLLLIGPREPGFWPHLTAQPEWDGGPDPVDRWSRRVIGRLACDLGGKALFPFGGPPWHPFYRWALRTGRVWDSPVRLLIHDTQGLMVSFRGALALKERLAVPPAPTFRPCDTCSEKPCLAACPVGALNGVGYDVPACHSHLDTPAGAACMTGGCLVRRACPGVGNLCKDARPIGLSHEAVP